MLIKRESWKQSWPRKDTIRRYKPFMCLIINQEPPLSFCFGRLETLKYIHNAPKVENWLCSSSCTASKWHSNLQTGVLFAHMHAWVSLKISDSKNETKPYKYPNSGHHIHHLKSYQSNTAWRFDYFSPKLKWLLLLLLPLRQWRLLLFSSPSTSCFSRQSVQLITSLVHLHRNSQNTLHQPLQQRRLALRTPSS